MSFAYRTYRTGLLEGRFNHRESATEAGSATAADVRAALLMTGTGAATDTGQVFVGDIVGLLECNGASYARQALSAQAVADLVTSGRFTSANWSIAALGAGTGNNIAVLIFKFGTVDADSRLMYYLTIPPFQGTGIAVPFQPDSALGLCYVT